MCNINSPYHGTYEHTIQYQPIAIHTMHHHTVLFNVYSIIHTILHLNIESDGIKILELVSILVTMIFPKIW